MNTIQTKSTKKMSVPQTKSTKKMSVPNINNNNLVTKENSIQERNIKLLKKNLYNQIGILDPNGNENNPLTKLPYINMNYDDTKELSRSNFTYKSKAIDDTHGWINLPMYKKTKDAIKIIYDNQVILIVSGTGSGKTVLTPKYVLHTLNYEGKIAITNPKRIPSEENAIYAAKTLDVKLGKQVGLKYRNSPGNLYSASESKLVYCTDGYILARLMSDPLLLDYDSVIIDEAHERGVNIDLLLLLLKELLLKRPEFKLVIMSATVNQNIFINYFPKKHFKFGLFNAGEAPNYPIQEYFISSPINKIYNNQIDSADPSIEAAVEQSIDIMLNNPNGDILIFIGGPENGRIGCNLLLKELSKINKMRTEKIYCDILHSGTKESNKELIKDPEKYKHEKNGPYTRKVIFATEVAESSITIRGIDFVIDTGLVHKSVYYPASNLNTLERSYISKASHKQRLGRTGRIRPGTCYNLFTKKEYNSFQDFNTSPIYLDDISHFIINFFANNELVSHVNLPFTYKNVKKQTMKSTRKKSTKSTKSTKSNIKDTIIPQDLATVLHKFIEPPDEKAVQVALWRLYILGGYDISKNKGTINNIGISLASFDLKPELGRMLLESYNYKCRDEICILVAILEKTNYRIDVLFNEPKKSKFKNSKELQIAKKKYKKVLEKFSHQFGDAHSLINIYKEYSKHKYDKTDKQNKVITPKLGNEKEWCKNNFLNENKLSDLKYEIKQIQRKFGPIIQRARLYSKVPNTLFAETPIQRSNNLDINILKSIIAGNFINIIKKENSKFISCFPEIKLSGNISRDSLYKLSNNFSKYVVYSEFKSIFNRTSFGIISKLTPSIIADLQNDNKQQIIFSKC